MPDALPSTDALCFGPFTLDVVRRELRRAGARVEIGARALDLLAQFVRHPGTVMSGTDLIRAVWQGRAVEANNLTVQLSHLRRALGDDPGTPYIRTMTGVGYMFMAEVTAAAPGQAGRQAWTPPGQGGPAAANAGPGATEWLGRREPSGPFVGRAAELADVARRVGLHRLVTISGMGGVGKTRLALHVATMLGQGTGRTVVVVDLAPLSDTSDAARVSEAVAVVLCGGGDAVSLRSIVATLRSRRSLLVLDNAEHVAEPVRAFVQSLLPEVPGLSVLVTSRGTLGIPGESVLRLAPLPVPDQPEHITAAEALDFDCVRIFVTQAALLIPGFVFDDAVAPHVAAICRRLDGIALAINMAVPRLQVLSPSQLAERLQQHFGILASATRDALPRQRTLHTMFDWSWALLAAPERSLLKQLAVYSGGAPLGMLVAMAAREGCSEWDTLSALVRLVENSLVISDLGGTEPRYGLLETTRVFALTQAGDEVPALRAAHAEQVLALMRQAERAWPTLHGTTWLELYGAEVANLRAAVTWALGEQGDPDVALQLVAYGYSLWWERPGALLRDGRAWLEAVIGRVCADTPPGIAARLWFSYSWRDSRMSDIWNLDISMKAVELFRSVGDRMGQGSALWRAGCAAMTPETFELSERLFTEAEALLRGLPTSKWLALCLGKRADLLARRGETATALALDEEALEIVRSTGHDYGMMTVGSNMADVLLALEQPQRALEHLDWVIGHLRPTTSAPAVATQAAHQLLAGQAGTALATARRAATQAVLLGLTGTLAWSAETVALIEARQGAMEGAARLAGYAKRVHPAAPFRFGARRAVYEELHDRLSGEIAPGRLRTLQDEGAGWTDDQAGEAIASAG